jgi:UDP-N-acetylmuramate--alanine ligase
MRDFGHRCVEYCGSIDKAVEAVLNNVRPKDLVLTLGAGNVWQAGEKVLDRLRESS